MCGRRVFIFYQKFDYLIKGKKMSILVILGLDTHILDAKTNPLIVCGPDIFAYLKHIGVKIKEKNNLLDCKWFLTFWEKYRAEKASL